MRAAEGPVVVPAGRRPVVLVAHPSADRYGSDRVLLESVAGLVRSGRSVHVTLPGDGPLVPLLRDEGATVVVCAAPRLSRSSLTPAGALRLLRDGAVGTVDGLRLLRRLSPDAVYVSTVTLPWWLVLARLVRVPAVAHVHEAEESMARPVRTVLAAPLLLASSVVANSAYTARVLAGTVPWLRRRVTVVDNAIVPPPSAPSPPRERLTPPVRLLYVGRLSYRKGVDVAVRAVARLRDLGTAARLDLVGDVFPGYEWYRADLERLVAELELGEVVRFRGYVDDVWPSLDDCDVVLVPSRLEESFGNAAVEAVLAARPVVAARSGGLVDAVGGYASARLVAADDVDAVVRAVSGIVSDWDRTRTDAGRAADEARARHLPDLYRRRLVAAVAAVERSRPRRRRHGCPGPG